MIQSHLHKQWQKRQVQVFSNILKFPLALVILSLMGALVFVLIPLKCLKELLHCLHLPRTQNLYFFIWSLTFFRWNFNFCFMYCLPLLLLLLPPFHVNLLQLEYHLYSGRVSHLGGVKSVCKNSARLSNHR